MTISPRTTCRVCGGAHLIPLFSLGDQHVSDFPEPGKEPGPRVPIEIELCGDCTLVQQRYTAPAAFLYTRHYWYRSGVTQTMRDALKDVVRSAMRVCPLSTGDVVLDIGSNDGTLLRFYPDSVVRVGVEPASNLAEEGNRGISMLIPEFWPCGVGQFKGRCKIITACGMFYDLDDPNPFVAGVKEALDPDGIFIAQLMCLKQTVAARDVGNFCHEHLEFYTLKSLHHLLERHGLGIFDVQENAVNGGSYRLWCCHRGAKINQTDEMKEHVVRAYTGELGLSKMANLIRFYHDMKANRDRLMTFVEKEIKAGKRFFVYGASTKGNVILQWCELDSTKIIAAADRSPEKWGRVTVGTNIPIVSEEAARQMDPDYFIVLPYAFVDEFIEREKDQTWRKRGGKFVVPLPEFRVL